MSTFLMSYVPERDSRKAYSSLGESGSVKSCTAVEWISQASLIVHQSWTRLLENYVTFVGLVVERLPTSHSLRYLSGLVQILLELRAATIA